MTLPVRHDRSFWNLKPDLTLKPLQAFANLCVEKNQPCTFFVVGAYALRYPERVRWLSSLGFEIASHSMWHEDMSLKSVEEFRDDVRQSKAILEDITQTAVLGFRAPSFSILPSQLNLLYEEGYRYDASTSMSYRLYGGRNGREEHLLNDKGIARVPFIGHRIFGREITLSGGGYFRVVPPFMINRLCDNKSFNGFYFHPHDFVEGYQREENINLRTHILRLLHVGDSLKKVSDCFDQLQLSPCGDILK